MSSPFRSVRSICCFFSAILRIAIFLPSCALLAETEPPFRNPEIPVEQRVDDLISRLTVQEKISQTMMASPEIKRLGIPAYHWWSEALHGVARNGTATVFPQAIGLAATWNPSLHQQVADVISTEARAKYNETIRATHGASAIYQGLTLWSPNINIFRDPRWGRGQETYGEDPFLTGRFGVAFVRGLQGDDPKVLKTVATLKHFAVHSGPEGERHKFDAVVSARDLHETYLPAFEAGIREGGAWSLMSAYNAVNGVPAPANTLLLQKILRGDWGFKGAVVGDVDTVRDLFASGGHNYSKNAAEASAVAIKAGNDLCSGTAYEGLADALKAGLITEADIDAALRHLFLVRFKLGLFDPAQTGPYSQIPLSENDSPAHQKLALEASRQSLVLLKNDGVLPWKPKALKTVAVIGPTAGDRSALLGNYSGFPSRPVTLLAGIRKKFEALGIRVAYERGAPLAKGFRENGNPLPSGTAFADESLSRPGFSREVFTNRELSGEPASRAEDEEVDFSWGRYNPVPGIPVEGASVRWKGFITAPTSGEYVLSLIAKGAVRVYVDDNLVIDDWKAAPERVLNGTVTFVKGKPRRVRLDYAPEDGRARIALSWKPPGVDDMLNRALDAARSADGIVLTLGITPDLEGEEMRVNAQGFSGGDRTSLSLPESQRELLERVASLGKPLVVVLTNGSPLSFDITKANAILEAWYYGQSGGEAVAEALLGETNPGGRLPVTFYQSENDLPPFNDYSMANRTYRYFTGKPLFAFGHGLSYSTFEYGKALLSASQAGASETVNVSVRVVNTGERAGDEVVQIYAHAEKPPVAMPQQWLVGFQRVWIEAGSASTISIPVKVASLRRWDEQTNSYVVDPGSYELRVGAASDRILASALLEVR